MLRIAVLTLLWLAVCVRGAPPEVTFLILKTGEAGATPEKAGPFLSDWAAWLSTRVGEPQRGEITNDPARAVELAKERDPAWGIVTPAFLLDHEKDLGLRPLLETRRGGHATDRYSVVVKKGGSWDGGEVATNVDAEASYLEKAVFAGKEVRLRATKNLADDVYAMIEGDAGAPAAVLLDRASREFFEEDDLTWPNLDVAWESEELPPDVVVGFGPTLAPEAETKLRAALTGMLDDDEGKKLCRNLQTEGFGEVDAALWQRVRAAYAGVPR